LYVIDGLRAVCGCVGLRAVRGCVGLRAVYVLSAIVSAFSCRFWKPPCTGDVLPKFLTYNIIILLLQSRTHRRGPRVRR
jgi:hypothetical protein